MYLGMVFYKRVSMEHADSQLSRALVASFHRVLALAKEHGVRTRLDLVVDLYQTYAVSSGMYAAAIWSTAYLTREQTFGSHVQSQHCAFLRFLVKARKSTCRWSLLHELGQKPFQFYWWKTIVRFWNKIVDSNSPSLQDVVRSDIRLSLNGSVDCWVTEVLRALNALPTTLFLHFIGYALRAFQDETSSRKTRQEVSPAAGSQTTGPSPKPPNQSWQSLQTA